FRGPAGSKQAAAASIAGVNIQRQPLRPLSAAVHNNLANAHAQVQQDKKAGGKPIKQFSVYSDRDRPAASRSSGTHSRPTTTGSSPKRKMASSSNTMSSRPAKSLRPSDIRPNNTARPLPPPSISQSEIEDLIARRIDEKFAERALSDQSSAAAAVTAAALPADLQKRLDSLEQRVAEREGENAEGLQYLLMAKQHLSRGEEGSALKMFQLAGPWFPGNEKLTKKIETLKERLRLRREEEKGREKESEEARRWQRDRSSIELATARATAAAEPVRKPAMLQALSRPEPSAREAPQEQDLVFVHQPPRKKKPVYDDPHDEDYAEPSHPKNAAEDGNEYASDESFHYKPNPKSKADTRKKLAVFHDTTTTTASTATAATDSSEQTPRTRHLLHIINSRDVAQIRLLKGVGAKKAQAIVDCLCETQDDGDELAEEAVVTDLVQLGRLRGVGVKTVENMRGGIVV
ncbi:hypothetical protein LTS18_005987, partial [Coniosporium uncinatum]